MTEPHQLTIAQAAKKIRLDQLTPLELVDSLLARIEELEPKLDAWVTVDAEGARKTAKTLTAEAKRGILRGLLHGIPVGELRGISNIVTNRDTQAWRIKEAATAAQEALLTWIAQR